MLPVDLYCIQSILFYKKVLHLHSQQDQILDLQLIFYFW
jgi:hypothetical protein